METGQPFKLKTWANAGLGQSRELIGVGIWGFGERWVDRGKGGHEGGASITSVIVPSLACGEMRRSEEKRSRERERLNGDECGR